MRINAVLWLVTLAIFAMIWWEEAPNCHPSGSFWGCRWGGLEENGLTPRHGFWVW
jgi:hypothetical protein